MNNITDNNFNGNVEVDRGLKHPISIVFETLFLENKKQQKDLAYYLGVHKSFVSRIVNFKEVPELRVRLKIAEFFNTDSSLIWKIEYIQDINELIKNQKKSAGVKSPHLNTQKINGDENEND